MPYIMNPHKLWVKDPDRNAYLPQNVIATQTADEQIALVEAAGAPTIAAVQQAVADSQAAVDTLRVQTNTIASTIASMAQYGTDDTLSTPHVAADAAAAGKIVLVSDQQPTNDSNKLWIMNSGVDEYEIPTEDEVQELKGAIGTLRNLFKGEYADDISVVSGGLHGSDGSSFTAENRCRTTYNTLQAGQLYYCLLDSTDYRIQNAFLYNPQGIGQRIALTDDNSFTCSPTEERNRIRISFAKVSGDSSEMTETDIEAISGAISIHFLWDASLTLDNAIADSKAIGDKFDQIEEDSGSSTEYVNKFYFNLGETPDTTVKGITYSIGDDGVLTLNGTPTENVYFQIMGGDRKTDIRNLEAGKPVILKRELISGTATGFPVFRNTYDYSSSAEGTAIVVDTPFVPTADGCLFLRLTNTTSFTNARYRFMVVDGSVPVPYVKRMRTANDLYFRQKFELSEKNKMMFDAAIQAKNRMLFSAHRGAEGQAPYGSYPSYELACRQGWDVIQIAQVRQSSDGTWYCLHDPTVDAQTNGTGSIVNLTDAYISTIYQDDGVNVGQYTQEQLRLPTLESVLKLAYRYGVMVSIRMGSLPSLPGTGEIPDSWTSFINLCKKYRPERMMFSGNLNQVKALKALTPNWHGQVYVTDDTIISVKNQLLQNEYTNISILGINTYVTEAVIEEIHDAGYYFAMAQINNPTVDDFIGFSSMRVDISQTGLSDIHSIAGSANQ